MRDDLAALTADVLSAAYNAGLVKRAVKELDADGGPALSLESDQSVKGAFSDGTVTRIPPGTDLIKATCTCGAPGVCRHRIAVALACGRARPKGEEASATLSFEDDLVIATIGVERFERAKAASARGLIATVVRAGVTLQVSLPASSVVLAPNPAHWRCDCASPEPCEHLALAVFAARHTQGASGGPFVLPGATASAEVDASVLESVDALVDKVLDRGAVHAAGRFAEDFAKVRHAAEQSRMTWLASALEDLERMIEAYGARSARYGEERLLELLVEVSARARSARNSSELPATFVLGVGEAPEVLLDKVRLVSLGARLDLDGRVASAEVYLADPVVGSVSVLRAEWTAPDGQPLDVGPALGQRLMLPRIDLATLATGNLVSRTVRRRANMELLLGTRTKDTTLLPGSPDLSALPPSLLVRRVGDLRDRLASAPPRCLRPRVLADGMVVFAVGELERLEYDAATQVARATARDEEDDWLELRVEHRAAAPYAIDAFAKAVAEGARYVTGRVSLTGGVVSIDAVAIATEERLVALDLAPKSSGQPAARSSSADDADPLSPALTSAGHLLAEVAHHGFSRATRDVLPRVARHASDLESAGLLDLSARFRALSAQPVPRKWMDAAIRWTLTR